MQIVYYGIYDHDLAFSGENVHEEDGWTTFLMNGHQYQVKLRKLWGKRKKVVAFKDPHDFDRFMTDWYTVLDNMNYVEYIVQRRFLCGFCDFVECGALIAELVLQRKIFSQFLFSEPFTWLLAGGVLLLALAILFLMELAKKLIRDKDFADFKPLGDYSDYDENDDVNKLDRWF